MFRKLIAVLVLVLALLPIEGSQALAGLDQITCCEKRMDCCWRGYICCRSRAKPCCAMAAAAVSTPRPAASEQASLIKKMMKSVKPGE